MSRALLAVILLIVTAVPAAVSAQPTGGEVRRAQLPNGLTVIVRRSDVAPVVAVSLLVRMGTRWETAETAGLSNFVHAVIVKGTAKHSGAELAEIHAVLDVKVAQPLQRAMQVDRIVKTHHAQLADHALRLAESVGADEHAAVGIGAQRGEQLV